MVQSRLSESWEQQDAAYVVSAWMGGRPRGGHMCSLPFRGSHSTLAK